MLLHVLTILICELFVTFGQIFPKYYDVSVNKCDGSFSAAIGYTTLNNSSPEFLLELRNTPQTKCRWICSRQQTNCWMIQYFDTNNCRLFSNISISPNNDFSPSFDLWVCADSQCAKIPGRCDGYWVGYDNFNITSTLNFPLKTVENIHINDCQGLCSKSNMCGSLKFECAQNPSETCTYSPGKCTITFGYLPFLNSVTPPIPFNNAISWRCCLNAQENFEDNTCRQRKIGMEENEQSGMWKMQPRNNTDLKPYTVYANFSTLDFKVCIDSCTTNPFCIHPIHVNGSIPKCYLALSPEIGDSERNFNLQSILKDIYYYIWRWDIIDCDNSHKNHNKYWNKLCFCFPKTMNKTIKNVECGDFVNILDYKTLDLFADKDGAPLKLSDGKINYDVDFATKKKAVFCDMFFCKFYNNMVYGESKEPPFIPRDQWFARNPAERNKISFPVEFVIMLNTYVPDGRCFSKEMCSEFVRDFQQFHMDKSKYSDIAYNFLIGEDGNVYEGRGWSYVGAHTRGYNTRSIGVAFIGWFEKVFPNQKSLLALKQLIKNGIERKYLMKNVKIKCNRDFRPTEIPGIHLKTVIDAWQVTDLTSVNECVKDKIFLEWLIKILSTSLSMSFIFSVVLILTIFYCHHKTQLCKKILNRRNLSNWEFECIYQEGCLKVLERINVNKDWIYVCEQKKSQKVPCSCILKIELLWIYSIISPEVPFFDTFDTMLQSNNFTDHISVFLLKGKDHSNPKQFFIFHSMKEQELLFLELFKRTGFFDPCICRKYVTKQYPCYSHKEFFRRYNWFLETNIKESPDQRVYTLVKRDKPHKYQDKTFSGRPIDDSLNNPTFI